MCVCVCVCVCKGGAYTWRFACILHVQYECNIYLLATNKLTNKCFCFWLQNLYAPDPDPELLVEHYERTKEQEDEMGISDMKTEGYEQES